MKQRPFLIVPIALVDGCVSSHNIVSWKPLGFVGLYAPFGSQNDWNDRWKEEVEAIDSKIKAGNVVLFGTRAQISAGAGYLSARISRREYRTMFFDGNLTITDNDIIWQVIQADWSDDFSHLFNIQ